MARKYKLLNWSRKCEYHGTSYGSYVKIIYIVLILYINLNFPMSLIRWNTRLFYSHWCGQINCKVIKCTLQLYSKGITLRYRLDCTFPHVCVFFFFFFFFFFLRVNSNLTWVHCSHTVWHCLCTVWHCSCTVHVLKNIKNGTHDTIYTFKNYFATVFSVFSFQF